VNFDVKTISAEFWHL